MKYIYPEIKSKDKQDDDINLNYTTIITPLICIPIVMILAYRHLLNNDYEGLKNKLAAIIVAIFFFILLKKYSG